MQTQRHNPVTRAQRICAALLLFLLWPPLLTVLTASNPAEAALPVCCRAHGKHHCAMSSDGAPADRDTAAVPHLSERCPYQNTSTASTHPAAFDTNTPDLLFNDPSSALSRLLAKFAPIAVPQRSHRPRGPPVSSLPA